MTAPTAPSIRAGDRDRENTANVLGQALAQGYLDMPEYERRVQAAFSTAPPPNCANSSPTCRWHSCAAATRASGRPVAGRPVVGGSLHLAGYLAMVVIVLTVWLAVALSAGAWYFWPIWPILGAGIGVVGHAVPIRLAMRG